MRFRDEACTELAVLDFGLAFQLSFYGRSRERQQLRCGTKGYMSPELEDVYNEDIFPFNTPGADVYAMGVVLYKLLYPNRSYPYYGDNIVPDYTAEKLDLALRYADDELQVESRVSR